MCNDEIQWWNENEENEEEEGEMANNHIARRNKSDIIS